MFIYVIKSWIQGYETEYGGRLTILAESDSQAIAYLTALAKDGGCGYGADRYLEFIPEAVANAPVKIPVDMAVCIKQNLACPSTLDLFET